MSPEEITSLMRHTFFTALEISAPFLLIALIVGVIVSFLQSMTHLHEMTLSFVPKMICVVVALTVLFPWILKMFTKFTSYLLISQWEKVTHLMHYVL